MKAHKRLFLPGYQRAHKHWQRHLEAVFSHLLHLLVRLTYRKGDECLPRLLGCSSLDLDSICRRQDNNFSCDFAAPPPRPSHHGGSPVCLSSTLLLMPTPYLTFYLSYSPCGCLSSFPKSRSIWLLSLLAKIKCKFQICTTSTAHDLLTVARCSHKCDGWRWPPFPNVCLIKITKTNHPQLRIY